MLILILKPKGKDRLGEHLVQMAPRQIIYIKPASELRDVGGMKYKEKPRRKRRVSGRTLSPALSLLSRPHKPAGTFNKELSVPTSTKGQKVCIKGKTHMTTSF